MYLMWQPPAQSNEVSLQDIVMQCCMKNMMQHGKMTSATTAKCSDSLLNERHGASLEDDKCNSVYEILWWYAAWTLWCNASRWQVQLLWRVILCGEKNMIQHCKDGINQPSPRFKALWWAGMEWSMSCKVRIAVHTNVIFFKILIKVET